ncbi:MAG: hypothetical protein E7292_10740 [Lachnospiraceae bacterium]|nr:hypothetical protein [Lachnospiraceae bacterium]
MDTFMDKLAQKFTAQELIKANSLAETEEMNRLKVQVEEYTGCLNRMKQICVEMEQAVETAKDKMDSAQLNTDELRDQLLEIWQTMQTSANENGNESVDSALLAEQMEEMRTAQLAQMEALRNELDERIAVIKDSQANQANQMESLLSMQSEHMESIRDMQQAQMESINGLKDAQVDGIKGLQDAQFENVRSSLEDQLDNMRSMVKAQINNLKSNQDGQIDGLKGALDKQNETIETTLGEMKENLESQLSGSNDFVHRECVKVYRNVQAAMGEENNKQIENLDYTLRPMSRRIIRTQKLAIAAVILSGISALIQVLGVLGIM